MPDVRDRLERDKETLAAMLRIYCTANHQPDGPGLCADCDELSQYACARLEKCPVGPDRGPCSKCEVHCYKPDMRKRIQDVMRYSGPKMLTKHPVMAILHLLKERKAKRKSSQ